MTNPTEKQPKDGQAGWIMGYGMPKPDTVESVLAEMREYMAGDLHKLPTDPDDYIGDWIARLAAAQERETGALRNEVVRYEQEALRQQQQRLAAHCRAEAAEGLLREARNWIDNDTDEVAAVIARIDAHLSGVGNG